MAEETNSPGTTGSAIAQTVAVQPAGGKAIRSSARTVSTSANPANGKRKGGRPRIDGLPSGSPEAIEADKKRDRERKQEERGLAEPPPLPSALAPGNSPGPSPAGVQMPGSPAPEGEPLPWQPDAISGVVSELIEAAEQNRVASYLVKCAEAGLGPKLSKEIENDCRFPGTAKVLLKQAIPRLIAKWLNKAGLSAEWQDEISVLTAVILIVKHNWTVSSKFDKLIEANNPKPAEPKKETV